MAEENQKGGGQTPAQPYQNLSRDEAQTDLVRMLDTDPELRELLAQARAPAPVQKGVKPFNEVPMQPGQGPEGDQQETQNSLWGYVQSVGRGVVELGQESLKFATAVGAGISKHTGLAEAIRTPEEYQKWSRWYENTPVDQMGIIDMGGGQYVPLYASDAQMESWKGNRTQSQKVVEGITQFAVGMANAGRWVKAGATLPGVSSVVRAAGKVKAVQVVGQGMAAGAATDFTFFDPHEERLSNVIRNLPPEKYRAVAEYLTPTAAEKDDSEFKARMKNVFEGALMGAAFDAFFYGLKAMRTRHLMKSGKATEEQAMADITTAAEYAEKAQGGAGPDDVVKVMPGEGGKTIVVPTRGPPPGLVPHPQAGREMPAAQVAGAGDVENVKGANLPKGFVAPEVPRANVVVPEGAPKGSTPVLGPIPAGKNGAKPGAHFDKPDISKNKTPGSQEMKAMNPVGPPKEPTSGGQVAGAAVEDLRGADGMTPEQVALRKQVEEEMAREAADGAQEVVPAQALPEATPAAPVAPAASRGGSGGTAGGFRPPKVPQVEFTDPAKAQNVAGTINMAAKNEAIPSGVLSKDDVAAWQRLRTEYQDVTDPREAAEILEQLGFNMKYAQQPGDVINVVKSLVESMPEAQRVGRGSKTWSELAKEADGILDGMTGEELLNSARNLGVDTDQLDSFITAFRTTIWAQASKVKRLSDLADSNPENVIAADQLREGLQTLWNLQAHLSEVNANVARALASNQMPIGEAVRRRGGEMAESTAAATPEQVEESITMATRALDEVSKAPSEAGINTARESLKVIESMLNKLGDFRNPTKANVAKPKGNFDPDGNLMDLGESPSEVWKAAVKDATNLLDKFQEGIQNKLGDFRNDPKGRAKPRGDYSAFGKEQDLGPNFKAVWNDHMKKLKDAARAEYKAAQEATAKENKIRGAMGLPKAEKPMRPSVLGPHRSPVASDAGGGVFDNLTPKQIRALARSIFLTDGDPAKSLMLIRSAKLESEAAQIAGEDQTWARQKFDQALNLRMNAMLSGPKTQITNIISNTLVALQRPLEYWWAGVRDVNPALEQQGADMLVGLFLNLKESWAAGRLAFKNGENVLDPGTGSQDAMRSLGNWGIEEGVSNLGVAKHWLHRIANLPSRMLLASDEVAKQMNYRANVRAELLRRLRERGITDPKQLAESMEEMMEFQFDTTGHATNMTGLQYSRVSTFTNDLEYGLGKSVQDFVNSHPAARLVLPFVKTPTNIFRYTWERTPLLNRFNKTIREELEAGGERAALARAKTEMGVAFYSTAAILAYNQQITGKGPSNPQLRKQWVAAGFQPYSIRIGDRWVSYRKGDPVMTAMGLVADVTTVSGEMSHKEWEELPAGVIAAVVSNLTNKSFMQGMAEFMDAVSDDGNKSGGRMLQKFLVNTAASFIPNIARQMDTDDTMREAEGFVEEMMSRVPGFSDNLEARTNIFGEPVMRPPGGFLNLNNSLNPFTVSAPIQDGEVQKELVLLGRELPMPAEKIGEDNSVNLKDREKLGMGPDGKTSPYARMMQIMANPGPGKQSLRQAMEKLVNSEQWKRASGDGAFKPGGLKYKMAAPIIAGFQAAALQQVIAENPNLREALKQSAQLEAAGLKGGTPAVRAQAERFQQLFVKPRQ